jgi:hypothetical protein
MPGHAACAMHQFGHAMFREFYKCIAIIDINPRIGLASRTVELREVGGDIDASGVKAEITMMIRHRHFFEQVAVRICFDEEIGPTPINSVFVVGADTLEMSRINAFAGGGVKISRGEGLKREESENEQTHGSERYFASP